MKQIVTFLFTVLTFFANAQTYDTLPKNIETKKVSISKVVEIPNTKKEDIYSRMTDWYVFKTNGLQREVTTKNKDKEGEYQLAFIQYVNFDPNNLDSLTKNKQKLIYKVALSQLKHGIGPFGAKWKSGYEYAFCILLIKDNKYKIEFTDFYHLVTGDFSPMGSDYSGAQWKYDEDVAPSLIGSKKKWLDVRLEGVNKYQKLMDDIITYLKKPSQTSMDF